MRDWCNDEQTEFTNRQICSINGFKLRTRPRYVSSQPAINRLFFIPTFAVVSFFNKFNAILLNTAILEAALPSFERHWSSLNDTSNHQCNEW